MIIYSMTATFGKLEHRSLELKPGLNVIHAPNEWGKSTWCAFLFAMLYGLDTRGKSVANPLPEKLRYLPWSGSPMSGRIELCWKGRDITIQRSTQGRIPLGQFRAYETDTGLDIPELDGSNCGQVLLGVERSVFRRTGFIRLSDLPVTEDDALRRRLNQLVTTGDDSGDQARLEKGLRELKNRCRYNRSGALPQAEGQRGSLLENLQELEQLETRLDAIQNELEENARAQRSLTNHTAALAYSHFLRQKETCSEAEEAAAWAEQKLNKLEASCKELPSQEEIDGQLSLLRSHRQELEACQESQSSLPLPPEPPEAPEHFRSLSPEQAFEQVREDTRKAAKLRKSPWWLPLFAGIPAAAAGALLLWQREWIFGSILAGSGCLFILAGTVLLLIKRDRLLMLSRRYGSPSAAHWLKLAEAYQQELEDYRRRDRAYRQQLEELNQYRRELKQRQNALWGDGSLEESLQEWEQYRLLRWELENARLEAAQARREHETLKALLRPVPPPAFEDTCRLTPQETAAQLEQLRQREGQLRQQQGQCRGRMEALGDPESIKDQLHRLEERIAALQQLEQALILAQQAMTQASAALQRRFAPQIAREAQRILSRMTDGEYDRLTLSQDFSLLAGKHQEDTLKEAQWRSDGTLDQLYLSLRLSAAQALTPEAPLILDDALARFDEERMEKALEVLKELSQSRQVILFSCQKREAEYAEKW